MDQSKGIGGGHDEPLVSTRRGVSVDLIPFLGIFRVVLTEMPCSGREIIKVGEFYVEVAVGAPSLNWRTSARSGSLRTQSPISASNISAVGSSPCPGTTTGSTMMILLDSSRPPGLTNDWSVGAGSADSGRP
jgi:hypothetical protein